MKKGVVKKKKSYSNRFMYTFIALGIIIIITAGVYAATYSASGAGHNADEIDFSTGALSALFSTNDPSYPQVWLNTWGLSSAGEMYLEAATGRILWLTDSWSGTGQVKVIANKLTVGPDGSTDKITLSKDGTVTATKFIGDGSQLTGVSGGGSSSSTFVGYCKNHAILPGSNSQEETTAEPAYYDSSLGCTCRNGYTRISLGKSVNVYTYYSTSGTVLATNYFETFSCLPNTALNCPSSKWTDWGSCNPSTCTQSRTCYNSIAGCSASCDGPTTQACLITGGWTAWSACRNSVGNKCGSAGTQSRTCTNPTPVCGGSCTNDVVFGVSIGASRPCTLTITDGCDNR
jgi:hypothetical protein